MKHSYVRFEWLSFLAAMGLMSRVPIGLPGCYPEILPEHRSRSSIWYPLVGLFLGVGLTLFTLIYPSDRPLILLSILLLILWVLYTGAIHLDGLADAADAWIGGLGDSQRTLRIMRDPHCGPMAVVVLVMVLLLKFVLIFCLLQNGFALALLVVPVLARAWLLPLICTTPYARDRTICGDAQQGSVAGMASEIASSTSFVNWISFALAQSICLLILFSGRGELWFWVVSLAACTVLCVLLRRAFLERVGGYTGDLLGASIELQELLLLTCACLI